MASKRAPSTDEEIRAHTIGELKTLAAPVLLVEYDPEWPELYQREAARIRSALGSRTLASVLPREVFPGDPTKTEWAWRFLPVNSS
jgi:hypothetical protein